jgi:hypothetical protein
MTDLIRIQLVEGNFANRCIQLIFQQITLKSFFLLEFLGSRGYSFTWLQSVVGVDAAFVVYRSKESFFAVIIAV